MKFGTQNKIWRKDKTINDSVLRHTVLVTDPQKQNKQKNKAIWTRYEVAVHCDRLMLGRTYKFWLGEWMENEQF